jgi:NTE family protein
LAFHAGALWALDHDLGWDARTADIIVGTSAGSIVGALLRSGVAPEDLAAWATDAEPSKHGVAFREVMERADRAVTRAALPRPNMPGGHMWRALRHPSQLPGAMVSMLPSGLQDHSARVRTLHRLVGSWPSEPLWISAVRVGDGRLDWFGRDPHRASEVKPSDAVSASCAIPVLARPVRIGEHRYIDGGVTSPTHADVLAGTELDLVIVLSPMGHQTGRNPLRAAAHRKLHREVGVLRADGIAVQLISPDPDTVGAMGLNMMDRSRTGSVMRHAFLGTTTQLESAAVGFLESVASGPAARSSEST